MKRPKQFCIYPTTSEHALQISLLHAKLFNPPWKVEFVGSLIDQKTSISFVASQPNKDSVLGFLLGSIAADEAEIFTLGVDVQYQRLGIASELLNVFLQKLKDCRAKRAFLEVRVDNVSAERIYKKFGFKVIGIRKNYYERSQGSQVDAVIMSLSLEEKV